jgi:hypothetical protein
MPRGTPASTLDQLSPMLLVERKAIPREPGWLYEIKFDGYRVLASTGSTAQLKSPGGIDAPRREACSRLELFDRLTSQILIAFVTHSGDSRRGFTVSGFALPTHRQICASPRPHPRPWHFLGHCFYWRVRHLRLPRELISASWEYSPTNSRSTSITKDPSANCCHVLNIPSRSRLNSAALTSPSSAGFGASNTKFIVAPRFLEDLA